LKRRDGKTNKKQNTVKYRHIKDKDGRILATLAFVSSRRVGVTYRRPNEACNKTLARITALERATTGETVNPPNREFIPFGYISLTVTLAEAVQDAITAYREAQRA